LLVDLRALAVRHSVLRGQILALGPGEGNHYGQLRFVARPSLTRDELILPDETLALIERHVVGIATHSPRLLAAGQHLKRGVLLYGPPGTGKTHTVRYLLSQRPGTTAFILSGQALQLITMACTLARTFTPSLVILEDVDLIGGDRSLSAVGSNPLLFEVLNQIDGLNADVDVTFLLTTNRVDILGGLWPNDRAGLTPPSRSLPRTPRAEPPCSVSTVPAWVSTSWLPVSWPKLWI
jgi:hypothetical protein